MDDPESLLLPAAEQSAAAPFLFSEFQEAANERLSTLGEFSGDRLFERRPEVYRAVVSMLAEGLGTTSIARACQVSPNTIYAVRDREGISIESERKELLRNLRKAAKLSVERALDLLPALKNAKDAAITAAVMIDKLQLLSGEATSRIEKIDVDSDILAKMVSSAPVLEGEFSQITGPLGGAAGQKAIGEERGEAPGDSDGVDPVVLEMPSVDTESTALPHPSIVDIDMVAVAVAVPVSGDGHLPSDLTGGAGVTILGAARHDPTGLGAGKFYDKGDSDYGCESSVDYDL